MEEEEYFFLLSLSPSFCKINSENCCCCFFSIAWKDLLQFEEKSKRNKDSPSFFSASRLCYFLSIFIHTAVSDNRPDIISAKERKQGKQEKASEYYFLSPSRSIVVFFQELAAHSFFRVLVLASDTERRKRKGRRKNVSYFAIET